MKRILSILLAVFSLAIMAYATHNASGEILYKKLSDFEYEITLVVITEFCNGNADRPTATLQFGDGTEETVSRANGSGVSVNNCFKKNIYRFRHTFPGFDNYTVSYVDMFRNQDVINMSNSGQTSFYVESRIIINPFLGSNSSPTLLLDPLDEGAINQLFLHNPNAFDEDGDSLSFQLIPPKRDVNTDVVNYAPPATSNSFFINEKNGEVFWDAPVQQGLYNIAILIEEWRVAPSGQRVLVGCVTRDMQIIISETPNRKPQIVRVNDTCVVAGSEFVLPVTIFDTDEGDIFTVTASGGPFKVTPSATFNQPVSATDTLVDTFRWTTTCDLARKEPYQVVFKVRDSGGTPGAYPNNIKLVDLFTWQITIVPPAPFGLEAAAIGNGIDLNWEESPCDKAVGYNIYRRQGPNPFDTTGCNIGVPSFTGYVQIAKVDGIDNLQFFDDNNGDGLVRGVNYCYRVVARLPDFGESYASNESCDVLKKDLPIITNVDVLNTSKTIGTMGIAWSKPNQLDTTQQLPPYRYELLRTTSAAPLGFTAISSSSSATFAGLNDTIFIDAQLNTQDNQYIYRVDLYATGNQGEVKVGESQSASSVFITLTPGDNEVSISINKNVPWKVDTFIILRQRTGGFDTLAQTINSFYTDLNLQNGKEFCYKVSTVGGFNSPTIKDILINNSQLACATPIDTTAPCPPFLNVQPDCDGISNLLFWTNPNISCTNTSDVVSYKIFYTTMIGGEFELIKEITSSDTVNYIDDKRSLEEIASIAGCYYIRAVDSFGNESINSNILCVDNCPEYELPNVFTPNGDKINDLFQPLDNQNQYIKDVDFRVYTRWGDLVFETTNAMINWDGKHKTTGRIVDSGVYYYVCVVNEIRVEGEFPRTIKGFFHLYK